MSASRQQPAHESPRVALICCQYDGCSSSEADKYSLRHRIEPLARSLAELGYLVTIFVKGSQGRTDGEEENYAENYRDGMRTVVVPFFKSGRGEEGGCLEKEVDWLDGFISQEAAKTGCPAWHLYDLINSHRWEAGLLAERLLCRWRARLVAQAAEKLLAGVVPQAVLERAARFGWISGQGEAPTYFLGKLMLESEGSPATSLLQRARMAAMKFAQLRGGEGGTEADQLMGAVAAALAEARRTVAPAMHELIVAETMGQAMLDLSPAVAEWLEEEFDLADRHLWTPHSLATQEEEHQGKRAAAERRRLEERRSHEQLVCERTSSFVVTSLELAEHLLAHYRVPCEQMFYFPPCLERDIFQANQPQQLSEAVDFLSERGGLPRERILKNRLLFDYGPFEPSQHKELVLDAFSFVAREQQHVLLVLGGGQENRLSQELRARRDSRAELRERVIIVEQIPEALLAPLCSLASVFVSAAERERDGVNLLRAAACGTALVCSDRIPLTVQYLQPEAVIVPAGEVFDLARAIIDLLDDQQSCQQRGEQLRQKAAAFDWQTQARRLMEYLVQRGYRLALPFSS